MPVIFSIVPFVPQILLKFELIIHSDTCSNSKLAARLPTKNTSNAAHACIGNNICNINLCIYQVLGNSHTHTINTATNTGVIIALI